MASGELSGLSRRDFLKYCAATAAMLGLSQLWVPRIAEALQAAAKGKTPLIWLKGQGCKGCAVSLLNSDEPTPGQLVLDSFSFRFFPLLTASSGDLAVSALRETAERFAKKYVLLVEGSFPLAADGGYAMMGFDAARALTLESWLPQLARGALGTLAVGTCAAYGGIPVLFSQADVRTVEALLGQPTPAVPGCPPHPDWIVGTIVKLLLFGKNALLAGLDSERRPKEFYGQLVHDNCTRRSSFDAGIFVEEWNDNVADSNACLLTKGCRGPLTHADCPLRRWNQRVNWCIGAGAPCNGCTEPAFYAGLSPLFDPLPSVRPPGTRPMGVSPEAVGTAVGAATAIGVGADLVSRVARGKIGKPPAGKADSEADEETARDDTDRQLGGPTSPKDESDALSGSAATAETASQSSPPSASDADTDSTGASPAPAESSIPTGYFGPRPESAGPAATEPAEGENETPPSNLRGDSRERDEG